MRPPSTARTCRADSGDPSSSTSRLPDSAHTKTLCCPASCRPRRRPSTTIDDSVPYLERLRADDIDHDPQKIRPYRDGFEAHWKRSLPEGARPELTTLTSLGCVPDRPPAVDK
jgi:hypothetical protein